MKWAGLMERSGLSSDEWSLSLSEWERRFVDEQVAPDLETWRNAMNREAQEALREFSTFERSLEGSVKATWAKMEGLLDRLDAQARKAVKRKEKDTMGRLAKLHAWVQPDGQMQERVAHFDHLQAEWDRGDGNGTGLTSAIDTAMKKGHEGQNWSPLMHVLVQTPL